MKTETPAEYRQRCLAALGQTAHNSKTVASWCYYHPPRRPLPEVKGERNADIRVSMMVKDSLRVMCEAFAGGYSSGAIDALANAALTQFVREQVPDVWDFYERFRREREEIKTKLLELRRNEPTLEKEEA